MELLTLTAVLLLIVRVFGIGQPASVAFSEIEGGLKLAGGGSAPTIVIDSKDWAGVTRTENDLANDFGLVTRTKGKVATSTSGLLGPVIIAGTIGKSLLIDSLISAGKVDISNVKGKWESFTSALVANPVDGISSALVLAGSDKRGTIYALYDISEQIGVSPWYWFADVPPKKKDVQPALTNWIRSNYNGVYNSQFHAKVFELLLRLRANYFWPAMWASKFHTDDSKNGPLADEMGIVMGTSHTEPMARADKEKVKPWDWKSNQNNLKKYMQDGAVRSKNWKVFFTMGMRGDGDTASPTLDTKTLVDVITFQQGALKTALGVSNLATVPQMWCVYKEVGGYYQAGIKVREDITILWSDDNSVTRGVYYHFDYVGDPRNYKWINTIQLSKTWQQMHLAHQKQATHIWIVNVGDIKPLELPISHFLDMAYDMSNFMTADSTDTWLKAWATREFGETVAEGTAEVMSTYGKLIVRRKYELLVNTPFLYSTVNYNEAENVLHEWEDMQDRAQVLYDKLDATTQIAFFEIVLHPVMAGRIVQQVYINAARNKAYAAQKRMSANELAADVKAAYAQDSVIQKRYHTLLNGKWNHMMDQIHFGYNNWQDPASNTMPSVTTIGTTPPSTGILGVAVQGSTAVAPDSTLTLQPLDPYTPENRTIEIFARGTGSADFTISPSATYIHTTPSQGTISYPSGPSTIRAVITIDWTSAPSGSTTANITITPKLPTTKPITLALPLNNHAVPADFKGYIESNGALAIEMRHFTSRTPSSSASASGATLEPIPHYGRTDSGLTLLPITSGTQTPATGPSVTYTFYAFTTSSAAKLLVSTPPSFNVDPANRLAYAFALDDAAPVTVAPVPASTLGSMPAGWSESVVNGARVVKSELGRVERGKHRLRVWVLEPGTVVQRLVVDFFFFFIWGGLRG
ncbi:hypothetical protein CC80DRAFT_529292 [Byssothecium circinans]|uniref:Gylcosyl hydrolase 115 C-terminal domain-containing protein n=1 Tax=Byssothecium circinans TaxID=147558 RepID=A0A6A5TL86_9PLEO|nr:hypothetical protein CC80DRAFT_529292 [Byssothecium circinans]